MAYRWTNMYDPHRTLNDILTSDVRCVCGCGHGFLENHREEERVKFYVCGHAIKKGCFYRDGDGPYFCPSEHPFTKLDWYKIPDHINSGTLKISIYDPPAYHAESFQRAAPAPANVIVPAQYPSTYKVVWTRAKSDYTCRRCHSRFPLGQRHTIVWHMPSHRGYHRRCAQILCRLEPDTYRVTEFLAEGQVLLH